MASNVLAKLGVVISAITQGFDKSLQNSSKQLKDFSGTAATINKTLAAFGVGFGIYEVANGIKNAIGILADFEKTMSEVMAITGATGDEFNKLRNDALRLGASTKFTAQEVGQLQIAYGRLGFTTKEILKATSATLDLAAATGEDLAKSADVAGATVRGFALDASETQRVVDVMASSFNKSALGLDNFAEAMKYVAPVAHAAGATVEETTALLATLADAGIRGSMAGTSLRKIFTDITKDGRPLQERLAELAEKGITMSDAMDEVGRTAQTSLLILANNTEKTNQLAYAFTKASGEAAKMARVMSDNLAGDVTKLSSAWEGLILNLGKSNILREVTQSLTALIASINGVDDGSRFLNTLAKDLASFGARPSLDALEQHIQHLSDIRRELGKPFDIAIVEELASKYNLTSEAANQLYQVVLKANEALSFQEKAMQQFNEFVARNGYQDLNKAADDYKNRLYELVLAEEIRKRQFEDLQAFAKGGFENEISSADKQIAVYKRVIRIIAEYQQNLKTTEDQAGSTNEVVTKSNEVAANSLAGYKKKLEELNTEYENTKLVGKDLNEQDLARQHNLAQEINLLQDKIRWLELIRKNAGQDLSLTQAPGTSALTAGINEETVKRVEALMDRLANSTRKAATAIKEEVIDIGPAFANFVTDIAEGFGAAIAGTEDFGKAILKAMAGFAQQLGGLMIATGISKIAFDKFKGPAMVVAGAALVAAATATKLAINNRPNLGSSGSVSLASSATSNYNSRSSATSSTTAQDSTPEIIGVMRGQDLWLMMKNVERNDKKTRGG